MTGFSDVRIHPGSFGRMVDAIVKELGGYVNFHAHVDRDNTLDPLYLAHHRLITPLQAASAPLAEKQNLTGELHKGRAYQDLGDLRTRISSHLDEMVCSGAREVVSFIDATPDIGLSAIETAAELREKYKGKISFKIAAHPIFGFKEDRQYNESRFDVFVKACRVADIVGALPEKDDRPDSVGFAEHLKLVLRIGYKYAKPVHVHCDQDNDFRQRHTLDLIEAMRWVECSDPQDDGTPMVWNVHAISPAAYNEERFRSVLNGLKKHNVGVVVCPSAALSMFQNRAQNGPTRNSIARVFEMAYFGIPIRIGTDNVNDMYVPATPPSVLFEILTLANALRFYDPYVLAKFAAGITLNQTDIAIIRRHLIECERRYKAEDPNFKLCVDLE